MSETGFTVGVDIGGTNVKIGLVDQSGKIRQRRRLLTDADLPAEKTLTRLARMLLEIKEKLPVTAVGIGVAGLVDHRAGIVTFSPNLPLWRDIPVKSLLSGLTGLEVSCANDANAVVLGEWLFGAARGAQNVLGITIGTGIGTGIIANNHLLLGANGFAGELGHTVLFPKGATCACGNTGCLERYTGARAITARCRRLLHRHQRRLATTKNQLTLFGTPAPGLNPILELVNYNLRRITPREIGIAARKGDPLALRVIQETGKLLGIAIYNAVMLLDPEIVVLGGGVSRLGKPLLLAVEKTLHHRLYGANRQLKVVLSRLRDDAGILGASRLKDFIPR